MDSNQVAPAAQPPPAQKKTKTKKAPDPANTGKAIEDTIAQLEKNKAGDKEQEAEIEREVKRANREVKGLLDRLESPMARLDSLHKRYTVLLTDMKRHEREHAKAKKRADVLQKERDSARAELTKKTTMSDKMEKLSRELTKDNKKLKDDHKRLQETESQSREELHSRLEDMTSDVQQYIDFKEHPENQPENVKHDELFRSKFKSFIDQYELRELQFHALLRTKELEVQYQVARYEQQRKSHEQEAGKSRQLTNQVSTFSQTETELRSQLSIYVEKFKQEMEEMSKKTKRLEKENHNLERTKAATSKSVYEMAEDRQKATKELDMLRKKNANLEKLCRGMQQQGRGQMPPPNVDRQNVELDSEGTESDYEDEYEDDEEGEYDDDTEEEAALQPNVNEPHPNNSNPAPLPASNATSTHANHTRPNGQVNGVRH